MRRLRCRKNQGRETGAGSWPEEFRKGAQNQCFQRKSAFCLLFDYSTNPGVDWGVYFGAKRGINSELKRDLEPVLSTVILCLARLVALRRPEALLGQDGAARFA
jgi:hypothetical protein